MPRLGLSTKLNSSGIVTPGIVTDGLVMKHMYSAGAYFDGDNDYIQLPFALNSANVTISAWVMLSVDDGNAKMIFGGRDSTNVGLGLFLDSAERLIIKINGDACSSSDANLVGVNKWAHVVGTYDGDIGRTYINGVAGNTIDVGTDGITGITTNARIGINAFDTANDFEGYICNVGYWNRLLTQAEIKSIMFKQYADLTTSEKTSLVSFWNLDTLTNDSLNHYGGISEKNLVLDEHNTYSSNLLPSSEQTGDSNWTTSYGDSATVITGPTTENYKSSPSSIKWVPATTDDGVRSSGFTTTAGQIYEISFWAYTTNSGNSAIRAKLEKGVGSSAASDDDDGSASTDINFTVPSANQWHQYIGYVTQEISGSTSKVIITSGGQSSGDYYIDDISIREVTNAGRLV
jgi:hypothetical protein